MRAVDTNVLVRYVVGDDAAQFRHARRAMESGRVFVAKTVLLEAEWVLRRVYGAMPVQVLACLEGLAAAAEVELEDRAVILAAIEHLRAGLDFADALHLASRGAAVEFVTFDRRLAAAARKAGVKAVVRLG